MEISSRRLALRCRRRVDPLNEFCFAPVAQLDRVLDSESKGHRFESCRVRHFRSRPERIAQPLDWLLAAPGEASRPSISRAVITSTRLMLASNPASRQAQKQPRIVETGGKHGGSIRHWQPPEAMNRIASTTSRISIVRGCPPRFADGPGGAINAHSRAVKSLGKRRASRLSSARSISVQVIGIPL